MNKTLQSLVNAYADRGTGSVMLYYEFNSGQTGFVGGESSTDFTGCFLNSSPAANPNRNTGIVLNTDASTSALALEKLTGSFYLSENSGVDMTYSNIQFEDFSHNGFLNPDNLDSTSTFLFSFEKFNKTNGVIFGSLNSFSYSQDGIEFNYGKGFNIGINDRNKLFFQGIDSSIGEYMVVADNLELANKNICSATVSPYSVKFCSYNLIDDEFEEQYLRTDSRIENNSFGQKFTIGGSPTYLREGQTFSGAIDQFLVLSGEYPSSDLKSIASGFVATGIPVSGQSYIDEVITGFDITLVAPVGVTGYQLVATGTQRVITESDFVEIVLVENPTPYSREDGERFITGYVLPNNSGSYLEETSFLIPETDYTPTGNDAFATLGLEDSSDFVTRYTLTSTKKVTTSDDITLYEVQPITGLLLSEPTGYQKTYLFDEILKTGDLVENLSFIEGKIDNYKLDYIHYLDQRI